MPQRFLRPGITASKNWDGCSWQGQSFYIRLITLVDDYGRYEANPMLLKSHAFPLREDIRAPQVQKLCEELSANQLAVFYKTDGKDYVQLLKWQERPRSDSRFPAFDNTCEQMFSDVSKCSLPKSSPSPSPSINSHRHKPTPAAALPLGLQVDEFVVWWGKWLEHLKAKRKPPTIHTQEMQLGKMVDWGVPRSITAIQHSIANGWQGLFEPNPNANNGAPRPEGMSGADKMIRRDELQRVESEMKRIRDGVESHQDMSAEDRAKLKKLKDRREILKRMLGLEV